MPVNAPRIRRAEDTAGGVMRRSVQAAARIDNTEDILAGLARIVRQTEGCEKANDYMELQQQVIAVTGYEYGRERVAA